MKSIPVREAVGLVLCHDITEIVPGGRKGPAFRRGHVVRAEDIDYLLRLGKEHLYVRDETDGMVHEDDAARRIARAVAGPGVLYGPPKEGRINFTASRQGLLRVDLDLLAELNGIPDVTIATAHTLSEVAEGRAVAGTRVIPLEVPEATLAAVEEAARARLAANGGPLLSVAPFAPRRVGVVTTGGEVYHGRVQDGFGPVLRAKFAAWGSAVLCQEIVPDETAETVAAIRRALDAGADMVAVTGGMSVDPDDKTPAAIRRVADEIVTYGAPVFPGAMFMLGYLGEIPIFGLPGCVMYHRASIFDLLAPRILAGQKISRRDIIELAHGGLCDSCPECRYPFCAFGK